MYKKLPGVSVTCEAFLNIFHKKITHATDSVCDCHNGGTQDISVPRENKVRDRWSGDWRIRCQESWNACMNRSPGPASAHSGRILLRMELCRSLKALLLTGLFAALAKCTVSGNEGMIFFFCKKMYKYLRCLLQVQFSLVRQMLLHPHWRRLPVRKSVSPVRSPAPAPWKYWRRLLVVTRTTHPWTEERLGRSQWRRRLSPRASWSLAADRTARRRWTGWRSRALRPASNTGVSRTICGPRAPNAREWTSRRWEFICHLSWSVWRTKIALWPCMKLGIRFALLSLKGPDSGWETGNSQLELVFCKFGRVQHARLFCSTLVYHPLQPIKRYAVRVKGSVARLISIAERSKNRSIALFEWHSGHFCRVLCRSVSRDRNLFFLLCVA